MAESLNGVSRVEKYSGETGDDGTKQELLLIMPLESLVNVSSRSIGGSVRESLASENFFRRGGFTGSTPGITARAKGVTLEEWLGSSAIEPLAAD